MSAPYMPLYVADYLADTNHLTTLEHGAYCLLLMAMWRAGGKLPGGDDKLARIARLTPAEWDGVRDQVMVFFKRRGGAITQKRLAQELANYKDSFVRRSEAGKRSQAKRANKNNEQAPSNVEALFQQPEPEPEPDKKPSVSSAKRKPTKSGIPANWLPLVDDIAYAAKNGMTPNDVEREVEKFSDWHRAKGSQWVDWSATWRTWVRRWAEDRAKAKPKVVGFV
jgi:uncharacterized protein YdaU (DUF1376 family)